MDNYFTHAKDTVKSHHLKVVAFAVLGAVIGGSLVFGALPQESKAPTLSDIEKVASTTQNVVAAEPTRLRIPAADIDTTFEGSLGLNDDQTVEVPESYEEVGWYKFGPKPGELGPAVVLGHVDSYEGPAVLYNLGEVEAGDRIYVDRKDGTTAEFEVIEAKRYPQTNFPTEDVYGDLGYPGLRVITCTGVYDHGTLRYSHNLVVYAKLIGESDTKTEE